MTHPETNSQTKKIALIGAGGIAQTHLQVFDMVPQAELAAIVDNRRETALATAEAHRCAAFESVDQLLAETSVDAAIVCTPPSTHPDICETLLSNGVHVLCEKPMAINRHACQRMIDVANENNCVLTMASKFRYVDDLVYVKQLIESGVLGDIVLFENTFAGYVDMTKRWNSQEEISGGGVLIDNGTHSVDIVRYLLGPIVKIQAIEGRNAQDLAVEDTVRINAMTSQSTLAAIDLSWSLNKHTPWFANIYGTAGTAFVGWKESKYKRASDSEWTVFGSGYDKHAAFANQLRNFLGAISGTEELRVTAIDAIASVVAIEAAYWSIKRHDWIDSRVEAASPALARP